MGVDDSAWHRRKRKAPAASSPIAKIGRKSPRARRGAGVCPRGWVGVLDREGLAVPLVARVAPTSQLAALCLSSGIPLPDVLTVWSDATQYRQHTPAGLGVAKSLFFVPACARIAGSPHHGQRNVSISVCLRTVDKTTTLLDATPQAQSRAPPSGLPRLFWQPRRCSARSR